MPDRWLWRKLCPRVLQVPLIPAIQTWCVQTQPDTERTYFYTPNSHPTTSPLKILEITAARLLRHFAYILDLYSSSRTKNEAWITHLNITHYLFHTIFSSDKSVFSENKHTDIMAENNVTLIPWEKIIRAFITAVLLDIHCVLFASELVFAAVTEVFGK